jgi:CrcB protein
VARFLLICLGGAVGTGARYLVSMWAARALGTGFPYGTLAVNVVGSSLLAFLMYVGSSTETLSQTARMTLAAGVLGGFTTYSTFSFDTFRYLHEGAIAMALVNVAVTVLACLGGCALGFAGARALVGS